MSKQLITNKLPVGKYLVAVSGGVDSISLLHAMANLPDVELVVAHASHGVRAKTEADKDLECVKTLTERYGLKLIVEDLNLDSNASEDTARIARHAFLKQAATSNGCKQIVTAHHRDDVIETMIINLIRGTGRHGLTSLKNTDKYLRPLIGVEKSDIVDYAKAHELAWNDDITNKDKSQLRNYVRLVMLPAMEQKDDRIRQKLYNLYLNMLELNINIDLELTDLAGKISSDQYTYSRKKLIMLPIEVSYSLLHIIMSKDLQIEVDSQMITRVRNYIHTAKPGKQMHINKKWNLRQDVDVVIFEPAETNI